MKRVAALVEFELVWVVYRTLESISEGRGIENSQALKSLQSSRPLHLHDCSGPPCFMS